MGRWHCRSAPEQDEATRGVVSESVRCASNNTWRRGDYAEQRGGRERYDAQANPQASYSSLRGSISRIATLRRPDQAIAHEVLIEASSTERSTRFGFRNAQWSDVPNSRGRRITTTAKSSARTDGGTGCHRSEKTRSTASGKVYSLDIRLHRSESQDKHNVKLPPHQRPQPLHTSVSYSAARPTSLHICRTIMPGTAEPCPALLT